MRVTTHTAGGVATVTLSDPGGHNALDTAITRELGTAIAEAERDPDARVILLRAEGRAFCVGGALDFFAQAGDDLHDELLRIFALLTPTIRLLHETPKITVVAAHGAVAGGGIGLMAAGDVVMLARGTVLTLGFAPLATNPDAGLTWFLPRDVGYRRALALYLTSEQIDAQRALELGLVTYVVDDAELDQRSFELAARIASGSQAAHATTKRLFRQAVETRLERQLDDEGRSFADHSRTPEFAAGIEAFLGKRADGRP